jgi:segregation and condensation protein B
VLARELLVETGDVREGLHHLQEQSRNRGIMPQEVAGGWQLRTHTKYATLLRDFLQAKPSRLSRASLETLSIVAYKQPLTRAEVEDIRGVDCGAVLRGLLERRLLRILGKKDEPGRPILYGTAPLFLELFGLKSLKELPTLREFVELSEEHQRIVDSQAPLAEEVAQREISDYLSELDQDQPTADDEDPPMTETDQAPPLPDDEVPPPTDQAPPLPDDEVPPPTGQAPSLPDDES